MKFLKFNFYSFLFCITCMAETNNIKIDLPVHVCIQQKIEKQFGQSCDFSNLTVLEIKKIKEQCLNQVSQNSSQNTNVDSMMNKGLDRIITIELNNTASDCDSNQIFVFSNDNLVSTSNVNDVNDHHQEGESELLQTYPLSIDGYNPLTEGDSEEATE